jgi:hypothetical protein
MASGKNRKFRNTFKENIRHETKKLFSKLGCKCEICGTDKKIQIHHTKYKFPIKTSNIAMLCSNCHYKLHKDWIIRKQDITDIFQSKIKRSSKIKLIAKRREISERQARNIVTHFEETGEW